MNFENTNRAKPDTNYMNAGKNDGNQYKNNFNRYSNSYLLQSALNERQTSNLNGGILNNVNHRIYINSFNQSSLLQASNNNNKNEEEEIRFLSKENRNEQNQIPYQPLNPRNSKKSEFINIAINNSNSDNDDQKSLNIRQDQLKPIEQQRQRFLNSFTNNSVERPFFNFVPNNLQRQPFVNIYSNSNKIQQQNPSINPTQNDSQKQPIFSIQKVSNLNVQQHQKATKDDEEEQEEEKIDEQFNASECITELTEEQFNADSSEQEEEKIDENHSNEKSEEDELEQKHSPKRKRIEKIDENHSNEKTEEDELEQKHSLERKKAEKRIKNYFDYESVESDSEHSSTSDFFYDESDTLQSKLMLYQQYCSQQNKHDDNLNENEHKIEEINEAEEEGEYSGEYEGILVYIFTGQHNTNENFTFRQLCKHYGLTAWDELNSYLPWRSRSDLRLTLMKMIRKQALSEYSGIRADPTKIGLDNTDLNDENYKLKGGLWVNKKWDKSPEEKKEIRLKNKGKYHIDTIEALDVDVPLILSHDYLMERVQGRKANLILFNQALSNEYFKRTGEKFPCSAGLSHLRVMTNKVCKVHKPKIVLKSSNDISKYVFDVPEFKDK